MKGFDFFLLGFAVVIILLAILEIIACIYEGAQEKRELALQEEQEQEGEGYEEEPIFEEGGADAAEEQEDEE